MKSKVVKNNQTIPGPEWILISPHFQNLQSVMKRDSCLKTNIRYKLFTASLFPKKNKKIITYNDKKFQT